MRSTLLKTIGASVGLTLRLTTGRIRRVFGGGLFTPSFF